MAVIARELHFSYNQKAKKPTLNGINLNCSDGSVYALFGPSGCGKTTLLDIMIGRRKPKSGTVLLYGYEPNTKESGVPGAGVGFMPQDIALQFDLTINEILIYFGTAQMMSATVIRKESDRFIKAFNLPEKSRLIGQLSGGQKRLVSLAVALLHKPRLLILDEPTVGVDPLLRRSFWDHLIDLSVNKGVTSIITTHYVHEAKRADVVAFMRKGEILTEGNPQQLIDSYDNVSTLDDVFITLCAQQGPRRQSLKIVIHDEDNVINGVERTPFKIKKEFSSFEMFYRITMILIWKHLIETKRNPTALIILFALTFTTISCVTALFGGTPKDLPVAWVVDESSNCEWSECTDLLQEEADIRLSNSSFQLREIEDETDEFDYGDPWKDHVLTLTGEKLPYLPDLLSDSIDKRIAKLVKYKNVSLAMDALAEHKVYAIIHLGSNFSESFLRCDPFIIPDPNCEANETIEEGLISLYTDTSNPILFDALRISISHSILKFRENVVKAMNLTKDIDKIPISARLLNGGKIVSKELNFEWFATPGFLINVPCGFSSALVTLRLVAEQESDMKIRNYVSGIRMSHVILADTITHFAVLAISTITNLYATIFYFDIPCRGSMLLVNLLSLMQVMLGITFGTLFATLFKKSMLSFLTVAAMNMSTLIFGGIFWSVEAQPSVIQWINYIFPHMHSVKSMRTLMLKEDATFYPQISNGFVFTIGWIAIQYIAIVLVARYYK